MTFYSQLSQVFSYSGTLSVRPPGGTLLLRRLQIVRQRMKSTGFDRKFSYLTHRDVELILFALTKWKKDTECTSLWRVERLDKLDDQAACWDLLAFFGRLAAGAGALAFLWLAQARAAAEAGYGHDAQDSRGDHHDHDDPRTGYHLVVSQQGQDDNNRRQ